jgi:hypothetical protein
MVNFCAVCATSRASWQQKTAHGQLHQWDVFGCVGRYPGAVFAFPDFLSSIERSRPKSAVLCFRSQL